MKCAICPINDGGPPIRTISELEKTIGIAAFPLVEKTPPGFAQQLIENVLWLDLRAKFIFMSDQSGPKESPAVIATPLRYEVILFGLVYFNANLSELS